jgi:hypothetical protein
MRDDRVIVAGPGHYGALLNKRSATDPGLYEREIMTSLSAKVGRSRSR